MYNFQKEFKIGDKVKHKYGDFLEIINMNWVDNTYLCVNISKIVLHPEWYSYDELSTLEDYKPASKCECGAKHTSASKFHLFYCPEYKDMR